MKKTTLISILVLLATSFAGAQVVVVWPGDANANGIANHIDLLSVGLGFGNLGPARGAVNNAWQADSASTWQQQTPGGTDLAHTDCDGDGIVNTGDTVAIGQNFGLSHGTVVPDSFSPISFFAPPVGISFPQDSITISGNTVLAVDIVVGDSLNPLDSIYGLAFSILFDTNLVDSMDIQLGGGFMNSGSGLLTLSRVRGTRADLSLVRTNQINTAGFGKIGGINIVMDDNLRLTSEYELNLQVVDMYVIDRNENAIPVRPKGDTLKITTLTTGRTLPELPLKIYPVPASDWLAVEAPFNIDSVVIFDTQGRKVRANQLQGVQRGRLDLAGLPSGMYLLHVHSPDAEFRQRILIQRE